MQHVNREISRTNTNKLSGIESSSQSHASELLLVRSKLEAVETPVARIHDRLPFLQGSVDTTACLVVSHSGVIAHRIQESIQAIREDLQRSQDLMQLQFKQQKEKFRRVEQLLEKFQQQNEQRQSTQTIAARAASKPAILKELCDSIQATEQSHSQGSTLDHAGYDSQNKVVAPSQNSRFTSTRGRVCICPRPHRLMERRGIQLGHVHFSSEWKTQGRWPSCPLSKTAREHRRAISLKYSGLTRILESVINISFAWSLELVVSVLVRISPTIQRWMATRLPLFVLLIC